MAQKHETVPFLPALFHRFDKTKNTGGRNSFLFRNASGKRFYYLLLCAGAKPQKKYK
jgi:hypothetical protein